MRLKTIHARSMQEAMELVREQMGAEAVIVATHEDEGTRGVRVTAASDADDRHIPEEERNHTFDILQQVGNALDDHGTPPELADRLLNSIAAKAPAEAHMALAGALDNHFRFLPLPDTGNQPRPIMLIGPPGGGKTSAVAKLAARAIVSGGGVRLISTDTVRAQGIEQLQSYATRLGLEVIVAPDPLALIEAIDCAEARCLVLIDTTGVNPYNFDDMGRLIEFTGAASVETILVLTAGRDPIEACEIATAYVDANPTRMLVSSLDMVRRLGGVLAAVDASKLAFSDVSPSPNIVNGLRPINAVSLARLLLPPPPSKGVQKISDPASEKQNSEHTLEQSEITQDEEYLVNDIFAPTGSN
ncbi:MAG: Flagellar biosynthesis protein FlhF [Alphaproteobacteria bacterium MarineAlpha4_Bin2]|nr:MAG: Flagellar biosynthesis protein FlhF [Alphaproteobacteria bacterium MarineAlpha4_Bin2]